MQFGNNQIRQSARQAVRSVGQPWRLHYGWILACVVGLAVFASAALPAQQPPSGTSPPQRGPDQAGPGEIYPPIETTPPDKNAQIRMQESNANARQADYSTANAERKKQIADDSAKLLKLATDLKAEVDKTSKDTLSLNVIRKADEIERLAHSVKEKMKLTAGGG
jgi:hypothetical protein